MKSIDETYVPVWRREGGAFFRTHEFVRIHGELFVFPFFELSHRKNLRPPAEGLKSDLFSSCRWILLREVIRKNWNDTEKISMPCSKDDTHESRMYHFLPVSLFFRQVFTARRGCFPAVHVVFLVGIISYRLLYSIPQVDREKRTRAVFETVSPLTMCVAIQVVLSLYAYGRTPEDCGSGVSLICDRK